MLNAQTYLEHIRRDGDRIAQVAAGNLSVDVPSCEGNSVESLLMHVSSVCIFWTTAIQQNGPPDVAWSRLSEPIPETYQREFNAVVEELSARDPDQPTWVWGYDPHVRFWYRRAAQELSIHRWDFENAVGDPM